MRFAVAIALLTALLFSVHAVAQRSTSPQARTAGELAGLCGSNPREPLGEARINYCHGFAQGAVAVELRNSDGKKSFCFPSPAPSRTETMSEFVNWVRAMPDRKSMNVLDGLFQFLGERYPCK